MDCIFLPEAAWDWSVYREVRCRETSLTDCL